MKFIEVTLSRCNDKKTMVNVDAIESFTDYEIVFKRGAIMPVCETREQIIEKMIEDLIKGTHR